MDWNKKVFSYKNMFYNMFLTYLTCFTTIDSALKKISILGILDDITIAAGCSFFLIFGLYFVINTRKD